MSSPVSTPTCPPGSVRRRWSVSASTVLASLRALPGDASGGSARGGAYQAAGAVRGGEHRRLVEQGLQGAVACWVVGGVGLSALPDHTEPGAGQDAGGVGVVVPAADGGLIQVGGP